MPSYLCITVNTNICIVFNVLYTLFGKKVQTNSLFLIFINLSLNLLS